MPMKLPLTHYKQKGWQILPNVLSHDEADTIKRIGEDMRINVSQYSDWKGISCAGKFDQTLFSMYTSSKMKYIANQILGDKVYLFNDQMVIKLPQDTLKFEPHYDNQFGPNSDGSIHTVNLSCILDDINVHNGGLEVQNQDDGRWVKLSPKKGDIVAIHGNTYHRSFKNNTNMSRGLYACVYADSPIHFKQFYTQEFI